VIRPGDEFLVDGDLIGNDKVVKDTIESERLDQSHPGFGARGRNGCVIIG
jgi:hypothetical protein